MSNQKVDVQYSKITVNDEEQSVGVYGAACKNKFGLWKAGEVKSLTRAEAESLGSGFTVLGASEPEPDPLADAAGLPVVAPEDTIEFVDEEADS